MTCRPGDMTCLRDGVRCRPADMTCLRTDMAIRRDGKEAFPPCKDIPVNRRRSLKAAATRRRFMGSFHGSQAAQWHPEPGRALLCKASSLSMDGRGRAQRGPTKFMGSR